MALILYVREVDYSEKKPKVTILAEITVYNPVRDFVFGTNQQTMAFIPSIGKYRFLKHEQCVFTKSPNGKDYLVFTNYFQNTFLRKKIFGFILENNLPESKNTQISRGDFIVIKEKPTLKRKEYNGIEIIIEVVSIN